MRNPAVDAYVAKSADFARPILRHVRKLMHQGDRRIAETIKWGVPAFEHAGIVAMMAAFKRHVAFGFWSEKLIREKLDKDAERVFPKGVALGMGGRRYLAREEPPPDAAILRAVKRKRPPKAPPYLAAALKKNAKARATWVRPTPALEWLAAGKSRNWKYQDC